MAAAAILNLLPIFIVWSSLDSGPNIVLPDQQAMLVLHSLTLTVE